MDLDSTNLYPRYQLPTTMQLTSSNTTEAMLHVNHDYNGVGFHLDTDGTTADSFQWTPDTTTGVCGDWDFAALTTGTGIDTSAAAITTGIVQDYTGITTITSGTVVQAIVNSADTGAWKIFHAKVDNTAATGAIPFVGEQDSTGACFQALSNAAGALGSWIQLNHQSASAADNDVVGRIEWKADDEEGTPTNTVVGRLDVQWTDATAASYASDLELYLATAAATNLAMTISGAGQMGLDLDSDLSASSAAGEVFDHLDDPMELANMSRDMPLFRRRMVKEGIIKPKPNGQKGYMLQVQPMFRLVAGGIYQNRARMDRVFEMLVDKIDELSQALLGTTSGLALPSGAVNPA
jgi:hypothetical protein